MGKLTLEGEVLETYPTKGGAWVRVIIAGTGRVNPLLMLPAAQAPAVGEVIRVPVRVAVETSAEGRPTRNVVFWPQDHAANGKDGA